MQAALLPPVLVRSIPIARSPRTPHRPPETWPPGKKFGKGGKNMEDKKVYIIPEMTSYTDEEILAEIGEAHALMRPPPASGFQ